MPSKSKTKGNTFERDVSKILNDVFNTNTFTRTFGSGAIVGKSNWNKRTGLDDALKTALASDIIAPEWFPFSIECKHYADTPNYSTIIKNDDKDLNCWLGKSMYDAINTSTIPTVFFKTDRKGIHVAIPHFFIGDVSCFNHYLFYNGFIIIGIDQYKEIIPILVEQLKNTPELKMQIVQFYKDQIESDNVYTKLYNAFLIGDKKK